MAKITLNINGNITDAQNKIAIIKRDLKSIEQFKIKISVDASGVQALDKSVLKSVDSFAKLTNAQARLKESENALAIQSEKTRQAEIKLEAQRERTRRSMQSQREETDKLNQSSESLLDNIQKNASWYLISGAVSAAVRSLRDAISTMKAVDDELVTVRKVTGMAGSELKALEEQAYQTASAYGQSAQDYLAFVSGFARAGYKEQSAALAELATKTQIVGDTSAETAQQFLLSVDAAYKYKGSITELSKVLDGANELDNRYATSIEKIAEGMGIVAPVAAQMHVTVDELAASIGTITAVTQRSGTEAARALRALLLNIVGDTKTEIDEGVTWTTGEIAGLRDVIKEYAPEAYKAAQATGSIIDPMEAIGGLAQSMKDGLLTEAKLMEMVSDIGGKLRTSQLLALIENWDMYQSMLADYGNALGSADREVENALDSWTRKTNQLSNTWAEFISHMVSTDAVKTGLDVLTGALGALDNGAARSVVSILAVSTGLTTLIKLSQQGAKWIGASGMVGGLKEFASALKHSDGALSAFTTLWKASPFAVVAIGVTAIAAAVAIADALNVTIEERIALLDEASRKYDEESGALDELNGKLAENQKLLEAANETGTSEAYKNRLTAENEELQRQITLQEERVRLAKEEESRQAAALLSDKNMRVTTTVIRGHDEAVEMAEFVDIVTYAERLLEVSEAEGKVNDELLRLISTLTDARDKLDPLSEAYGVYAARIDGVVSGAATLVGETEKLTAAAEENTAATEGNTAAQQGNADATESAQDATDKLAASASATSAALKDFEEYGNLTTEAMNGLTEAMGDSLDALFDETGALNDTGEAAFQTASEFEHAKDAAEYLQTAAQAANYANLIAQIQAAGTAAVISTQQIAAMLQAVGLSANIADAQARGMALTAKEKGTSAQSELLSYLNAQAAALNDQADAIARNAPKSGSKNGSNSSKSSSTEKDTELERLKAAVSLEKQRLSFLEASGAADDERIAKMQDIQTALHAQAEYLRSIGASEEDIKALSTEWWTIQNKITGVYEDQAKAAAKLAEEQKKAREEAQKAREEAEKAAKQQFYDYADAQKKALEKMRDAALKPLQEQLDALNAQRDAVEAQRKEQERLLAVEEARRALENAQNQRNVRQFNADTQQWEWAADSRSVEDAKKAVIDAEKALSDYHSEQLYLSQKKAVEEQISATKEAFEVQRDAWTEAAELVRSGALSIEEAMAYASEAIQNAASLIGSMSFLYGGGTSGGGSSGESSKKWGIAVNGEIRYSQKMPDFSRNTALAGQTVYTNGMNVTYNENGYATKASNPDHPHFAGTSDSVHAQSKESALAGKTYDAGGVLQGLGGIKATTRDEAVLNPDHTEKFLRPQADERLERVADTTERIMDLGGELIPPEVIDRALAATISGRGGLSVSGNEILTGARPMTPGVPTPETNVNRIGTQNNGDTYNVYVGKMPIQNVTQGTTLGEIAQAARSILPLYNSW